MTMDIVSKADGLRLSVDPTPDDVNAPKRPCELTDRELVEQLREPMPHAWAIQEAANRLSQRIKE